MSEAHITGDAFSGGGGARRGRPDTVRIRQVIEVRSFSGQGTDESPWRIVTQFFDSDGQLLAENDPNFPPEEHF